MLLDVAAAGAVSAPLVVVAVAVLAVEVASAPLPVAVVGVAGVVVTSASDSAEGVTSLCGVDLVPISDAYNYKLVQVPQSLVNNKHSHEHTSKK